MGGTGGSGGDSGVVVVNNNAALGSYGKNGSGIYAASIAGGGGRGGLAIGESLSLLLGAGISMSDVVGGDTGNGGHAGSASVNNSGKIIFYGDMSSGITAQSIGGRGGVGGIAIGGSASLGIPMDITIGSLGGRGGIAGSANVENTGFIATNGFRSIAITAQSIGGHGGSGGISMGTGVTADLIASSTISLGGSGGDGGVGSTASIWNDGNISTIGAFSAGLLAQSIGGDGGIGGVGVGESASAIAPSQTLGGNGGAGSFAGTASIYSTGSVTTSGDNSVGILAQSIGGSGGVSGHTKSGVSSDRAGVMQLTSGDTGGSGATAYQVVANITGPVATYGAQSTGIALESIGGGGGRAGSTLNDSALNTLNTTSAGGLINLGATGGAGGDGGYKFDGVRKSHHLRTSIRRNLCRLNWWRWRQFRINLQKSFNWLKVLQSKYWRSLRVIRKWWRCDAKY